MLYTPIRQTSLRCKLWVVQEFMGLTSLEKLRLDSCGALELPGSFAQLRGLGSVSLRQCRLDAMGCLDQLLSMPSLEVPDPPRALHDIFLFSDVQYSYPGPARPVIVPVAEVPYLTGHDYHLLCHWNSGFLPSLGASAAKMQEIAH